MLLFYIIYLAWFLSEILVNRFLRSGKKADKKSDKGSLWKIWLTIGIANTLGIFMAFDFRFLIGHTMAVPYGGLGLLATGMVFRLFAIRTLGKYFTVDVTIREGHRVKKDGLYKYIRHPSYTGMLLSFAGFGLSLNNWVSLAVIFIPVTKAILYRVRIEERLLRKTFGMEYFLYMKSTKRLVPWIY